LANQIFLFYGEEDFLIEQKINELKADLSVETIDGEDSELEHIVNALQTQSMLWGSRLIIIRNVDLKMETWDAVAPSLKIISPGTKVVFWVTSFSRRSKLFKMVEEVGEVCEFKPFAAWEQDRVIFWIEKKVKSSGKQIEPATAVRLQEVCGSNLRKLSSEIDKLITFVGENKEIGVQDVLALASPGEINVFALSNALAEKDLKGSLSAFSLLCKNKVEFFRILSLLANQYRTMLFAKSEKNHLTIAKALGLSP